MSTRPSARDCVIYPRNCAICEKLFIARDRRQITCSQVCSRRRHNRSDDYHRWKRSKRRSVTAYSDITPQQEAEMRRRTRKCPLCGTWMTGKPGKPNSKHLDHIIPVNPSVGGTHTHGNVRIICRTCNLKRPKDGSDYSGPVTLWATAPCVVITPKPMPAPKPSSSQIMAMCGCGAVYPQRNPRHLRCNECLRLIGLRATILRGTGMEWKDVAAEVGYANLGNLVVYATRYGGYEPRKPASV